MFLFSVLQIENNWKNVADFLNDDDKSYYEVLQQQRILLCLPCARPGFLTAESFLYVGLIRG